MPDCKNCENINWKNHYLMAQERFDKVLTKLTIGTVVAFTIAIICLISTICVILKFERFIDEFEYVEETEIQIEQDWRGDNRVILDDDMEVVSNGAEVYGDKEEILAQENNKVNTIYVTR
jgi:ribosomal protein S8